MIDWEEVLEDINWTKVIIVVVAGLLVIGVSIFLLLDRAKANNAVSVLKADIEELDKDLETYEDDRSPTELKQEIEDVRSELDQLPKRLPSEIDRDGIKEQVESFAAENRVTIENLRWMDTRDDGFLSVHTLQFDIPTGSSRRSPNLLRQIQEMEHPHKQASQERSGAVSFEFYTFNEQWWNEYHKDECKDTVEIPEIADNSKLGAMVFGGSEISALRNSIDQKISLIKTKAKTHEQSCQLNLELQKLKTELDIVKNKI